MNNDHAVAALTEFLQGARKDGRASESLAREMIEDGWRFTKIHAPQQLSPIERALAESDEYRGNASWAATPSGATRTGAHTQNLAEANYLIQHAIWSLLRHQVESSDSAQDKWEHGTTSDNGARVPAAHLVGLVSFLTEHFPLSVDNLLVYFDPDRSFVVRCDPVEGTQRVIFELQRGTT